MAKKNREEEVISLMHQHLTKTEECLESMRKTIEDYLKGNIDTAKASALQTHRLEGGADDLRRLIIEEFYKGAFLPALREGLIGLALAVDKIADRAESCCDFIMLTRPSIPEELKEDFTKLVLDSIAVFPPLREAKIKLFEDFDRARELTIEVHNLEGKVDDEEWKLNRRIFTAELPLAQKMLLRDVAWHIASISDVIEDAADVLEVLIIKKRV
jgi:predicted phosphate transport protein (TIGR00153 family)